MQILDENIIDLHVDCSTSRRVLDWSYFMIKYSTYDTRRISNTLNINTEYHIN